MSDDFVEVLAAQLRVAALREERRGAPGRALAAARARLALPRLAWAPALAVAAVLGLLLVAGALLSRGPQGEPPARDATGGVVGRFTPADGLGMAVTGFGSAWLDDDAGRALLRLDPRTHQVRARFASRSALVLGTGHGSVWALNAADSDIDAGPLLRIDPATDRIVARIPARTPAGRQLVAMALLVGADSVWMAGPDGAARVDPATNRVTEAIENRSGYDLLSGGISGTDLWLERSDGTLLRHDARTGRRLGTVRVPLVGNLSVAGGALVIADDDGVVRLDPETGDVLWSLPVGWAGANVTSSAMVVRDGLLWMPSRRTGRPGLRLVGIDLRRGRVARSLAIPEAFSVAGLTAVGSNLWVTTTGGQVLVVRPG